jgi:hypothetical protein
VAYREDVSDETLDAIADAIEKAGCPDRQGPYGLFDYSYGGNPHEGAHRVRDFREPGSPSFGSNVHVCDDAEEARRVFEQMTRRHVAAAAWDAILESKAAGTLRAP